MTGHQPTPISDDEINLLDLLLTLAKRWRMIAGITLLTVLVSGTVTLLLPNRYQATAKVIALQRQMIQPINAAFSGATPIIGAPKPPLQMANMPILQEILQGNSLQTSVQRRVAFDAATKIKISISKGGALEITVDDTDPQRAAAIANAAVTELGQSAYALNLLSSPAITAERDLEKLGADVTAAIKLLEPATAPKQKVKPKRSLIVALSTFTAFFIAIFFAFALEGVSNLRPDDRKRWDAIKMAWKGN